MATVASRLKETIREHDIKTYDQLVWYVFRYCGESKRVGVVKHEYDLRRYIEARAVSRSACGMQTSTERTMRPKRGLAGCSMIVERKLRD